MPVFEFYNLIASIDCDQIFLRDVIARRQYRHVCFFGNSMSDYTAILFGATLNADKMLAFAPQTYIDRFNRTISFDRRWRKELRGVMPFPTNGRNVLT